MEVVHITESNADDFSAYIDEDMLDNLDRTFFRAIGALDDDGSPVGAMVFELKDSESEDDTKSRIRAMKVENDDVRDIIMSEYKSMVNEEEVVESFYEMPDDTDLRTRKILLFHHHFDEHSICRTIIQMHPFPVIESCTFKI